MNPPMDTHKPNTVQNPNDLTESEAKELNELFEDKPDTDNNINPDEKDNKSSNPDSSENKDWDNQDLKDEKKEDQNQDLSNELKKQSANSQRKIQEKHNRIIQAETKLVESNPEHFLELAKWDTEDKKLAKEIAKNLYNTSLEEAIKELSSNVELSPEQIAENLAEEKFRKKEVDQIKNSFIKNQEILNKDSENFNEEFHDNFLDIYKKLIWEENITNNEEVQKSLDDAYFLINRKNYENNIKEKLLEEIKLESVKNKISNSWTSWWTQWGWEKKSEDSWLNNLEISN